MATENLTNFDLTDSDSDFTVTATRVSIDTMKSSAVSWLSDSYGVDHFGTALTHQWDQITTLADAGSSLQGVWALTNTSGTLVDMDAGAEGVCLYNYSIYPTMYLQDLGGASDWDTFVAAVSTAYYITVIRSGTNGTNLQATVRTGSHEGEVKDTLTVTIASDKYEYLAACFSWEHATSTAQMTGYSQNYDINEAAAGLIPRAKVSGGFGEDSPLLGGLVA